MRLSKQILGKTRSAIAEYDMIQDGDMIAVGFSGGKDSLVLLALLNKLRGFMTEKFDIIAIIVDLGFEDLDEIKIADYCIKNDIPYHIEHTKISKIVFEVKKPKSPCALCSNLRRGALNNAALSFDCNKVALGHHADDVIHTFFLSLLYEGRFSLFSPVTYLSNTKLKVIRPMIYVDETEIISHVDAAGVETYKNPCALDKTSRRALIKSMVCELCSHNPAFKKNISNAIKNSDLDGWDQKVNLSF